jgi:hypothetical protein
MLENADKHCLGATNCSKKVCISNVSIVVFKNSKNISGN